MMLKLLCIVFYQKEKKTILDVTDSIAAFMCHQPLKYNVPVCGAGAEPAGSDSTV